MTTSIVAQLDRLTVDTFVCSVEWHDEIGSTSDRAIEAAAVADQALPLLVIAGRQTAGRGRGENRWWSSAGALTFSLVIDAGARGLPPARRPQLSLATALAVGNVVRQFAPQADLQLKWPNDVYIARRKACGILLEAPAAVPGRIVLGLGLNVNNSLADAPPEIRETAIALCDVVGGPVELFDVLLALLRGIEAELELLAADRLQLVERWRPYCLLEGQTVTLRQGQEEITGFCQSIDADGALLLHTGTGLRRFISGTVVGF